MLTKSGCFQKHTVIDCQSLVMCAWSIAGCNIVYVCVIYSRTVIDTTQSSQSPFSTPNSSQDSLHKNQQQQQQQKKKGIKSSLGRLFSKKEKQKAKGLAQDLLLPPGGYLPCIISSQDPVWISHWYLDIFTAALIYRYTNTLELPLGFTFYYSC